MAVSQTGDPVTTDWNIYNIPQVNDYNKVSVIDKQGNIKILPKNKKSFIAKKIAEILLDRLLIDDRNIN